MTTTKWVGLVLIIAGAVLLIFGLLSFNTPSGRGEGYSYNLDAKVEAAFGGGLIVAGAFVLRLKP